MLLINIFILNCVTFILITASILPEKLQNKFSTMRNKMGNLLNIKKNHELLLDINELEFPGANSTLKNIHRELWREYYDCLKEQYIETGPEKTLHSLALTAIEGMSTTMPCTLCISPSEMHTMELVEWIYNSTNARYVNNLIDISENILISADDRTLTLFNVQKNQEGLYWCQMGAALSAPYYLYVIDDSEPTIKVRPDEAPDAQHSVPPAIIEDRGLMIYSSWTPWSPCSTCDAVGKHIRHGFCMISLIDFPKKISSQSNPFQMKLTDLTNVLTIFQNKLPCRSWYTPGFIQEIFEVKNRTTEIMTGFCKVKCQRNIIFEIRDQDGNVLESANNSAGIYSTVQGIPDPRPPIVRVTHYGNHDNYTAIKCPGNLNTDIPIIWKIGTRIVNPLTINQQSKQRVSIDSYQRIIFKKLQYADENIYSCWQRNELVGTVRLKVTFEIASEIMKFNHRLVMLISIPVVATLLWVFWRAFQGRNRYTKH